MKVFTMLSKKSDKLLDITIPESFVQPILQQAVWFLYAVLIDQVNPTTKATLNSLAHAYHIRDAKHSDIRFVFEDTSKGGNPIPGHKFKLNINDPRLVKTLGKPTRSTIDVVIGLVKNPSSTIQGGMVGGEYDARRKQLAIYLLSMDGWENALTKKVLGKTEISALLNAVSSIVRHELIHAVQKNYPVDDANEVVPKNIPKIEQYYLDDDEFPALFQSILDMYVELLPKVLAKLPPKMRTSTDIKKLRADLIATITSDKPPLSPIVKAMVKPSGFFVALKKHQPRKWKVAHDKLVDADKKIKV